MGRRLDDVIAALPEDRRERVEARFEEMKAEVESLGELRRVAGKAQAEIALTLKIKQPSVSKIEKQADMYLSTLRSYVEAVGGQLELIVRLPSHAPLKLERMGDVLGPKSVSPKRTRAVAGRARAKSAEPADTRCFGRGLTNGRCGCVRTGSEYEQVPRQTEA